MNSRFVAFLREHTSFYSKPLGPNTAHKDSDDVQLLGEGIDRSFSAIYFITLPKRRANVKRVARMLQADAFVFKAINKDKLDLKWLVKQGFVKREYATDDNRGRIACNLSHMACCLHFGESTPLPGAFAFIMEDDITLKNTTLTEDVQEEEDMGTIVDRVATFSRHVRGLTPDATPAIHYLGYCHEGRGKHPKKEVLPGVIPLLNPKCRHAYMLNVPAARLLLKSTVPQYNNGDVMWAMLIKSGEITSFGHKDGLVFQNRAEHGTTLGNGPDSPPLIEAGAYTPSLPEFLWDNPVIFVLVLILLGLGGKLVMIGMTATH